MYGHKMSYKPNMIPMPKKSVLYDYFWLRKINATIIVSSSEIGTASHTPITPKMLGNVSNSTVINPKVRRNERMADSFPFDNAVNVAEVKIFSPLSYTDRKYIL